jgi:hypothetical protein
MVLLIESGTSSFIGRFLPLSVFRGAAYPVTNSPKALSSKELQNNSSSHPSRSSAAAAACKRHGKTIAATMEEVSEELIWETSVGKMNELRQRKKTRHSILNN